MIRMSQKANLCCADIAVCCLLLFVCCFWFAAFEDCGLLSSSLFGFIVDSIVGESMAYRIHPRFCILLHFTHLGYQ